MAQAEKRQAQFQIALDTAVNLVKSALKPWQIAAVIGISLAQMLGPAPTASNARRTARRIPMRLAGA